MKTQHLRRLQRAEIDAYALALLRGGVTRGRVIDGMPDSSSLRLIILGLFPSSLRMVNGFVGRPRGPRYCIWVKTKMEVTVTEWSHGAK